MIITVISVVVLASSGLDIEATSARAKDLFHDRNALGGRDNKSMRNAFHNLFRTSPAVSSQPTKMPVIGPAKSTGAASPRWSERREFPA